VPATRQVFKDVRIPAPAARCVCALPELAVISLGSAAETTLDLAFVIVGGVAAGFGLYLLTLSIGAFFYSGYLDPLMPPSTGVVVLVPAHDEAALIARCVRSLRAQTYPSELYEVVVVADNCTDETAAIAAGAGAQVMVRDEPDARGKGRALRWAIDRILAQQPAPDAVAVVDADSVADADFLVKLVQPFEAGAAAVQGESLLSDDGSTGAALRVAAFLLINRVRPAGRAVFHLPCTLAGNGMLFAGELLLAKPWEAFTSAEDLEYSLELRMAGVGIAFAGGAILVSPPAPTPQAAAQQQLRWEGGKARLARTWIPRLIAGALRERRPSLLGTALELAVPPLGFLAAGVLAGTAVGASLVLAGLLSTWALAPWLLALAAIPVVVLVGLRAGGAPPSGYQAMARAPLFILAEALRFRRVLGFLGDTWVRTDRASAQADGGGRSEHVETTEPGRAE
jgi:1,2-diacylglycerol 3-beta-glucosyltransferase